jgi:hypothetical protein
MFIGGYLDETDKKEEKNHLPAKVNIINMLI